MPLWMDDGATRVESGVAVVCARAQLQTPDAVDSQRERRQLKIILQSS